MFRKLILSAAAAAAVLAATAAPASAHPIVVEVESHHAARYEVLVRHHGHWHVRDTFRERHEAEHLARHLEREGYEVRVERVHGW